MSKQEEIIEIAGKKVVVRYAKDGAPCEKCVLNGIRGCGTSKCSRLDKVGMEIDERAYFVEAPQEKDYKKLYEELVNSEWYKKYYQGASVGDSVAVEQPEEEAHSLREWAQILATNPDLRAEFDKMCPPQPIQGSIAPEADVNKWAVTNAFLHCEKAGKIVSEMYGDKFNNQRNRDKYLAFLMQVNLDDRFGELAEILRRYGAMQEQKEQPEVDLEKLGEIARHLIAVKQNIEDMRLSEDEWSLIERIGYPERFNAKK